MITAASFMREIVPRHLEDRIQELCLCLIIQKMDEYGIGPSLQRDIMEEFSRALAGLKGTD